MLKFIVLKKDICIFTFKFISILVKPIASRFEQYNKILYIFTIVTCYNRLYHVFWMNSC